MIDSYGFTRSDNEDIKSYEEFVHKYHQILDHRSSRWTSLLSHSMPQKDSRKCMIVFFIKFIILFNNYFCSVKIFLISKILT